MPPVSGHSSGSVPPRDEEHPSTYHTTPEHTDSPLLGYSQLVAHDQPTYYPDTPSLYPQAVSSPAMSAPAHSYEFPSGMPGTSTPQPLDATHPTQPYVGGYGGVIQHPQRSDDNYYSPTGMSEPQYGHQFPFRQPPISFNYPEIGQPSSPHFSAGSPISQQLGSPDQSGSDARMRRIGEAGYGSMANSYRHIITAVSQTSSPLTDSSGHSLDRPAVDDMLHSAVEGLRHLDPSRAEQYQYGYDQVPGALSAADEAPPGTVFVQYYEDGRTEDNPAKKKRERDRDTRCASCQATSTPEWRRGPLGPRTLCNACGLVYAKLMKKRAKEEERLSSEPPRRSRVAGRSRKGTEEGDEARGTDRGSDDAPPVAGPSKRGKRDPSS